MSTLSRYSVLLSRTARTLPEKASSTECIRRFHNSRTHYFNEPLHGSKLMKSGGIASFMRLPVQTDTKVPKMNTLSRYGVLLSRTTRTLHVAEKASLTQCSITRQFHSSRTHSFNQPLAGNKLIRSGGIASFMRLPVQTDTKGLDACFVGVPLDVGASNRTGTRLGPRQIRCESVLLRPCNQDTGACPFDSINVADVGDISINTFNLPEACKDIKNGFMDLIANDCITLCMGGDHTITYPILQAIKTRHGSVGLIHVDAHADVSDTMLGAKITHGTPFRRALEEGLIDPHATFQIGLRGSSYESNPNAWQRNQGFTVYPAHELWYKSLSPIMETIRQNLGDKPVYLSFDIDAIDPGFCPGTGTPEIAGLTTIQSLEIIRGCQGLNIIGCDLVEVSPPYDFEGTTALTGANLLFEMLCVLPGVKYVK